MDVHVTANGKQGTIRLAGRFDFNAHRAFRDATSGLVQNAALSRIDVNFADVDYLDSSALAMLLRLREQCTSSGKEIALVNCRGTVREVLDIVNFGKLFTIS